jgi:hypothetical protein
MKPVSVGWSFDLMTNRSGPLFTATAQRVYYRSLRRAIKLKLFNLSVHCRFGVIKKPPGEPDGLQNK